GAVPRQARTVGLMGLAAALLLAAAAPSVGHPTESETLTVPTGQTVTGKLRLVPGTTYHAVVTGTILIDYPGSGFSELHDAFYCYETRAKSGTPGHCPSGPTTFVALDAQFGAGSASCSQPGTCLIPLGAVNAACCKPVPYSSTHRYENDFKVDVAGPL